MRESLFMQKKRYFLHKGGFFAAGMDIFLSQFQGKSRLKLERRNGIIKDDLIRLKGK